MARSSISNTTNDLMSDSGAVLWSFVKGEQLEFPITLDFITEADFGYLYEAVVVEAYNVVDQEEVPTDVRQGGIQTTLPMRVPENKGTWSIGAVYSQGDISEYLGKHYMKLYTIAEADPPSEDPSWEETETNIVYIRFPKTLAATWAQQPKVNVPVYGFFELRVSEPPAMTYPRTWKPVRGMVEIHFSPTDIVPDV